MTDACDYVGGDFYSGPAQHSPACKVYDGITCSKPFEFYVSRTRLFTDHVTMKPMEEIRAEALPSRYQTRCSSRSIRPRCSGAMWPAAARYMPAAHRRSTVPALPFC